MPVPDDHKDAILALLMLDEDLAYLIVNSELNIEFASREAAGYGVTTQHKLAQGPEWLAALRPRLAQLFERPSLFTHSTLDQAQHPIMLQAQVVPIAGAPRLLMLLRRSGDRPAHPNQAPYHAATGLYSAAFIENKIDEELERIKRFPSVFSLLALHFVPVPEPLAPLGDLLRIHFRATDIVGHAPRDGFLALLPGATLDQAQLAGARLAALVEDFRFALPAPIAMRYTAVEAVATDTRATLFARLNQAESILAHA
ncbi:MAG: hypothetical protein A2Z01_04925 [Betaproteobacteria bacterium RBG_16_58_11]|nr:MAG: hypothetical protein A2Z01_04925 [Betaproteobacteria bacterium RBG_16_58_11]